MGSPANVPQLDDPRASDHTAADGHDLIQIRGARENNLTGVSLDIPKRRLTVFTGVSGSGKSSLVFDTVAAESRRLIDETYTAFVQNFMPSRSRPDVDALRNLSAAIIVDQERMGANARSTVGTATDAHTMLRILFSRLGVPHAGPPYAFSFNRAEGMCPECEGLGRVSDIDVDALVDRELSLNEGAVTVPGFGVDTWHWQLIARSGLFDPDRKLKDYGPDEWEDFLHKPPTKVRIGSGNVTFEGLVVKVRRLYLAKDRESMQSATRAFADRAIRLTRCPACDGTRLNEAARSAVVAGRTITECSAMQIDDLAAFVRGIGDRSVGPVLETLLETLDSLVEIGLGVLTVVTGVAGSGKSSLIHGYVAGREGVVVADQSPIRGSRRSNPATYTGLLDPIRAEFARANGVKPGLFSANSDGACPACKGIGLIYTDLAMMAEVASVCEECEGRRFTSEVLTYRLRGKNISQVLGMPVAEAREFFATGQSQTILERLAAVGLGYLTLGQPLTTLSGGERQRLKLAVNMARNGTTYVLDEPTTGLHLADVDQLLALLDRLVDDGNTVIVIEHHQAVTAHADWIVDLGPGAGHDGGRVVFSGTPADLVETGTSLTARHLRRYTGRS
ncbi:ATP-binding cassette domain-containing protein [Microbispora sp. ATCC PTA-5024]|uniref:ATP-binding cassette domain-containing protein n=1 Tax=Microbispora sp. ATCC PTA-5024 TaxID=316330 RepID=UPI0003DBD00C|nr:ATP-binding cassette domain-containing protein [Microbispora sp. ATCC PTA-5024]ETK31701.1 ABC transporter [Microbispora sp. ATCC PTA-5024]